MRAFLFLIGLMLCLLIFGVAAFNISNTVAIKSNFLNIEVNAGFLVFISGILGSIATLFFLASFVSFSNLGREKLKKQIDDAKLNYEIGSDKVKQLEAKIQTLEEALKIATKQ